MSLWHRQCDIQRDGSLIRYCGNTIGRVMKDTLYADPIFKKEELIQWAEKQQLAIIWQSQLFEKLSVQIDAELEMPVKTIHCCIYQLKEDCDPVLRLCSFEELTRKGRQIEFRNYRKVFDNMLPAESLDEVCEYFDQKQDGYEGRALMVSDIIEVQEETEPMYYYIDKGCYRQLKPVKEEPAKAEERK